jgi:hypothetical protein
VVVAIEDVLFVILSIGLELDDFGALELRMLSLNVTGEMSSSEVF